MALISCAGCTCPVRSGETSCPHCGAAIRGADGPRTTAAIILGLTIATASCGDSGSGGAGSTGGGDTGGFASDYGVAATGSGAGDPAGAGGAGGGGTGGTGGAETGGFAADYGVAGTGNGGP